MRKNKLSPSFYRHQDVLAGSRQLLGKVLYTRIGGVTTAAVITETEAYAGVNDRASHAFGGRRTARTEPMYAAGGIAYVYLCYGIHHLFNVVVGDAGDPLAILVRGGEPYDGLDTILRRRKSKLAGPATLSGPGKLAQGLGITTRLSGSNLAGNSVWIEDRGLEVADADISTGPRIGIDYAGRDAALPYRFRADRQVILSQY